MTTNNSASATIYTFPPRGRFALRMHDDEMTAAANMQLPPGVKLISGSGWYHDAAIQEANKDASRQGR